MAEVDDFAVSGMLAADEAEADPGTMIKQLLRSWVSEKSAPELLAYEEEPVEVLLREIQEQEELSRANARDTVNNQFLFNMYQMEIGRLRYALNAYLRTRLWKIECHVLHILGTDAMRSRLSAAELSYAEQYRKLISAHMSASCLDAIPETFRTVEGKGMVPSPEMDSYVFCKVHDTIGTIAINEENDVINLEQGDIYIVRYEVIEQFLQAGRLSLI